MEIRALSRNREENNILLAEDDREIRQGIEIFLRGQGYKVFQAADGLEGLAILEREEIHLAIVDIMMPRMDGFSAIMKVREKKNIPIIIMSAKSEDSDKILGLSIGADDYISKPFSARELAARVKSQLRRYLKLGGVYAASDEVRNGRLCYDFTAHILTVDEEPVKLTGTETKIMELLMRHPGHIFPAEEIYSRVWGEPIAYNGESTVMVHIRRIREAIEREPGNPEYIITVWGDGYRFTGKKA